MEKDRRRLPRVRISIGVEGKHNDQPLINVKSYDINVIGIRLLLPVDLAKGRVMELEINFPDATSIVQGEVVWAQEIETREGKFYQTGIQFTEMKPADRAKLEVLIHNLRQATLHGE